MHSVTGMEKQTIMYGNGEEGSMKKQIFSICSAVILLIASVAMTGCKNDEPNQPAKVQTYHVSIQAGKGDANQQNGPRKALGLDGTTLTASWKTGEQVSVRNVTKEADLVGSLVAEGNGVQTMLSGDLTGVINAGDALELKFLSPAYTTQEGTLEYISGHCDYAVATIHVTSVNYDEITFEEGIADFQNRQAIVKFTLMNETKEAALETTELVVEVNGASYTVTPASETNELFVALPGFSDQTIKLTATVGSETYTFTSPTNGVTFEDGKYYTITVGLKKKVLGFSIDATHKIEFAKGNLQYKDSEHKWRIATNQYDFVGSWYSGHLFAGTTGKYYTPGTGNVYEGAEKCENTDWTNGSLSNTWMSTDCWVDLFCWNTWDKPLLITTDRTQYASTQADFTDWGANVIYDGDVPRPANYWRTLTMQEWTYIVFLRDNAEELCGLASITVPTPDGDVKTTGMILLPDDFVKPDGIDFDYITKSGNHFPLTLTTGIVSGLPWGAYQGASTYPNTTLDVPADAESTLNAVLAHEDFIYNQNNYTVAQWEQLEAAGAVFLPAAGWIETWQHYTYGDHPRQFFARFKGAYWSSTMDEIDPEFPHRLSGQYLLMTNEGDANKVGQASDPFYTGCSVRLVRDL
jgi:hypothetical protein